MNTDTRDKVIEGVSEMIERDNYLLTLLDKLSLEDQKEYVVRVMESIESTQRIVKKLSNQ